MELTRRAACRTQLTKIVNSANEFLSKSDSRVKRENIENFDTVEEELLSLIQRLKTARDNVEKANVEVIPLIKLEDAQKECDAVSEYQDKAVGVLSRLEHRLVKLRAFEDPSIGTTNLNSTIASPSHVNRKSNSVKLPKMELKRFSGKQEEWLPFWEQFKLHVHENSNLSSAEKFGYLQSVLIGRAAETIDGFTPTEACYDGAIGLLVEEVGNMEKIVDRNLQTLMTLSPVTSRLDVSGLRRLYNGVMSCTRSLTALGISSSNYALMLKSILLKCLPNDLRVDFYRRSTKNESEIQTEGGNSDSDGSNDKESSLSFADRHVKDIMEFLKREVESMKKAEIKSSKYRSDVVGRVFKTAAGLMATTSEKESDVCLFCTSSNHSSEFCDSVLSFERKKDILKKNGRCFRCLIKGHAARNCKVKNILCQNCGRKHATSMCLLKGAQALYMSDKANDEPQQALKLCAPLRKSAAVFLQTASVFISSERNSRESFVRLILDGGSQLSFIRQELSQNLQLPVIGTERLSVIAFGNGKQPPMTHYNKVRVMLRSQYNNKLFTMDAIEVPEICLDILTVPDASDARFLELELADVCQSTIKQEPGIGILIGADYYWKFVTGGTKRIEDKLTAIHTVFGWTLQGPNIVGTDCENICLTTFSSFQAEPHISDIFPVESLWNLDAIGITCDKNEDDSFTMRYMSSSITKFDQRYEIKLPWKEGSSSLNQCLDVGPNLLPDVLRILLNFRLRPIGIVADIEKAFLQISLAEQDRDSHRLLWYKERPHLSQELPSLQEFRLTRLTFGVNSSPFILGATIQKHLDSEAVKFPESCDILKKYFYMDDLVLSTFNEKSALQLYKESVEIMKGASMNLRKWNCNNKVVRDHFRQEMPCPAIQKVLGIVWYVHLDELAIDISSVCTFLKTNFNQNKRTILRIISSFYDPFGLLAPYTIRLKIFFQSLWRLRLKWDEALPNEQRKEWHPCCDDLDLLKELTIPRCLVKEGVISRSLHIFADASPQAYGTVAYLRSTTKEGEVNVSLLCAKSRVSPLNQDGTKELTLPRLELTAALLSARLFAYLKGNLDIKFESVTFWSDSKIALYWIRGCSNKWATYVSNRVKEINKISSNSDWRHCPGAENPADLLTRGVTAKALLRSLVWKNGPLWLLEHPSKWPLEKEEIEDTICLISSEDISETTLESPSSLFQAENFSSLRKLLRVTAYVFRFIRLGIKSVKNRKFENHFLNIFIEKSNHNFLTAEELLLAKNYWVIHYQYKAYRPDIELLKAGKSISRTSTIFPFDPFLDEEGLLRVKGRLSCFQGGFQAAHPLLLPKSSHLGHLLVRDVHKITLHGGVGVVLGKLRENFWIPQGRQLVKKIIKRCVICKRLTGKPASQPFGQLPKERMMETRPFATTGVDFAGPLYVKQPEESDSRKVYIMLLTCATTRAVFLEMVADLSTESCLLALRRFFARRSLPDVIYSDNAKTFKRTSLELSELAKFVQSEELYGFASHHGIKWKFIVERAPWWGGFWERLVRSVKVALKATLGRAVLNMDQLRTLLTEVEGVVNSRPLTYISDDPADLLPLSPSHILLGSTPILPLLNNNGVSQEPTAADIRLLWNNRLQAVKYFWKRWRSDYLQQLRSLHHFAKGNRFSASLKQGDVVIVEDSSAPRILWKLAIIDEVFVGRDKRVRACIVRFSNGSKLRRPIQLLYPLELAES